MQQVVDSKEEALAHDGCATADYRLSGELADRFCSLHLMRDWRMIVAGLASIASGTIYETWGQGIYYVMAVMAALGGLIVWLARDRLSRQPHKAASGG